MPPSKPLPGLAQALAALHARQNVTLYPVL